MASPPSSVSSGGKGLRMIRSPSGAAGSWRSSAWNIGRGALSDIFLHPPLAPPGGRVVAFGGLVVEHASWGVRELDGVFEADLETGHERRLVELLHADERADVLFGVGDVLHHLAEVQL